MIVLTVLSYNGAPANGPACTFDELGGTVGRADSNQLVLPDPERTISRVHARVVCKAGRYAVVDNGSNPISVNGLALGSGKEHPLTAGDRVQIGGYVLAVSQAAAAAGSASSDPFADLFGDAAMGLAAPTPVPSPLPARAPMQPPAQAPLAPPPPMARAAATPSPPAPPLARGYIPADWDPFAAPSVPAAAPSAPAALGADLLLDLPAARTDTLDALFGLSASPAAADPLAAAHADPLGASAAQVLQLQPNTAAHDDPLHSFGLAAAAPPASQSDHASELHTPMLLPPPAPRARPQPVPQAATTQLLPPPAAQPAGAVFSWDHPPTEGRVVTLPGARAGAAPVAPTSLPPAATVDAAAAAHPKAKDKLNSPTNNPTNNATNDPANDLANKRGASTNSHHNELLSALLQGLDAPGLRLEQLDAATMRLLGQLLRESLRGTVELLVARTALKREMRAQMTMIVPRENNPLKFSPTVEVALQHLLGPPTKGFMPPTQAVRDACDDLRAHQLGVMAGMRAALEGVLQRFDPQLLEAKLTRKSTLTSLIPTARKARLWELFQELFSQLQSEAQDDFDDLFGKAFLRAYEDQLDRLQGEPGPR